MKVPAGRDGNPIVVIGAFGGSGQEETQCNAIVERVDNVGGGQFLVKYVGCNYLFKGLLESTRLQATYAGKRILSGFPRLISNKWIAAPMILFGSLFILLPKKIKRKITLDIALYFSDIGWLTMQDYIIPKEAYCPAAKELYRTASLFIEKTTGEKAMVLEHLRDLICMIIHFDMAYRFRWQDIIPLFNKEAFKKNPRKEIMRVARIFVERESAGGGGVANKWKSIINHLDIILWFIFLNKKHRSVAVEFLDELDLDAIAPDEADWYYMLDRKDYDYGGVPYVKRMKMSFDMDIKAGNRRMKVAKEK